MYRNEVELFDCCDYIDTSDCNNFITKLSNLSIIQLNIHGLLGKQQDLCHLLRSCTYLQRVDVVILDETWLTETNESHVCLPGYTYYGKSCPNRKGGGVGFLINNRLNLIPPTATIVLFVCLHGICTKY